MMSVINQMLKDLDKRNVDNNEQVTSSSVVMAAPTSHKSPILLILVGVIVALVMMAFVWLFQENALLKQQQMTLPIKAPVNTQQQRTQEQLVETLEKLTEAVHSTPIKSMDKPHKPITNDLKTDQHKANFPIANLANAQVNDIKKLNLKSAPIQTNDMPHVENDKVSKPSLTIARKQLSPKVLAIQKLALAEKAMYEQEGEKAEQLLQDALLLSPDNKDARKQLAAIWYAQQQYQPALNLLNQGINLSDNEPDFRVMKAKILLLQQFPKDAYLALSPLADISNVDYQALLANTAQQADYFVEAIEAFKKLTQLQPTKAKWFLGLAIALDKNSQFQLAINAYKQAIALGDISAQSQQFALRRMTELGD